MWISPDCHGIEAVLVISEKQPSSGLLHNLRFICVCVWPLRAMCYNIASSSSRRGSNLVFPGTRSNVSPHRLTSTTQPLCHCARVYHNVHNRPLSLHFQERCGKRDNFNNCRSSNIYGGALAPCVNLLTLQVCVLHSWNHKSAKVGHTNERVAMHLTQCCD